MRYRMPPLTVLRNPSHDDAEYMELASSLLSKARVPSQGKLEAQALVSLCPCHLLIMLSSVTARCGAVRAVCYVFVRRRRDVSFVFSVNTSCWITSPEESTRSCTSKRKANGNEGGKRAQAVNNIQIYVHTHSNKGPRHTRAMMTQETVQKQKRRHVHHCSLSARQAHPHCNLPSACLRFICLNESGTNRA